MHGPAFISKNGTFGLWYLPMILTISFAVPSFPTNNWGHSSLDLAFKWGNSVRMTFRAGWLANFLLVTNRKLFRWKWYMLSKFASNASKINWGYVAHQIDFWQINQRTLALGLCKLKIPKVRRRSCGEGGVPGFPPRFSSEDFSQKMIFKAHSIQGNYRLYLRNRIPKIECFVWGSPEFWALGILRGVAQAWCAQKRQKTIASDFFSIYFKNLFDSQLKQLNNKRIKVTSAFWWFRNSYTVTSNLACKKLSRNFYPSIIHLFCMGYFIYSIYSDLIHIYYQSCISIRLNLVISCSSR